MSSLHELPVENAPDVLALARLLDFHPDPLQSTLLTSTAPGYNVPKSILVERLELLLSQGHLQIANQAPQAETLREELLAFERKLHPGGHTTYGANSSTHDDLVMALSLAGWWAWENRKSLLSGPRHKPLTLW